MQIIDTKYSLLLPISRDNFIKYCKELLIDFETSFIGLNIPFLFTKLESARGFLHYNKDDLETYFMIK